MTRSVQHRVLPLLGFGRSQANETGAQAADFGPSARRLLAFMRPEGGYAVAVLVLGAASILLNVLGPLVLARATDLVVAHVAGTPAPPPAWAADWSVLPAGVVAGFTGLAPDAATIVSVLVTASVCYLVSGILWVLQGRFVTWVIQQAMYRLRDRIELKLSRLPVSWLDSTPRGEVLGRTTSDVDNLAQSLQQTMSQVTVTPLLVLGTLVAMTTLSPLMAVVTVATVPLAVGVTRAVVRRSQGVFAAQWRLTGALDKAVEDAFSGHTTIVATHSAAGFRDAFTRDNAEMAAAATRAQAISGMLRPLITFVGNLNYVLVIVIGGLGIASGRLTVGTVQAFVQYTRQFTQPVTQIAGIANYLQSGVASAERVFAFLDQAEEPAEDAGPPAGAAAGPSGAIRFAGVSFGYEADRPVLRDVSFSVPARTTTAVVGPTGAGKTTLVNLLLRFYEPDSGGISLDGIDIARIPRDRLRPQVALVPQHTWLFRGTIADNIAFGRPDATREEIETAARLAHADRFVRTKAEGYDTVIDGNGGELSAGEEQLVAIARAFVVDAPVLVLDEATSSVDSGTELEIRRGLNGLRAGRTTIVVAHRLATVREADQILVLDGGEIVESGGHDELLSAGGLYHYLYSA